MAPPTGPCCCDNGEECRCGAAGAADAISGCVKGDEVPTAGVEHPAARGRVDGGATLVLAPARVFDDVPAAHNGATELLVADASGTAELAPPRGLRNDGASCGGDPAGMVNPDDPAPEALGAYCPKGAANGARGDEPPASFAWAAAGPRTVETMGPPGLRFVPPNGVANVGGGAHSRCRGL
mmetsp:Transcript_63490/g.176603  ORF Transcript_63490/g.176603 Transcript_63490/m.176603 type:complete len:181 (-) Transcript_63490:809-1351(-)